MSHYIQIAEFEHDEPIEMPIEDDYTLLLTTLTAQFPGATGMKYRNPDTNTLRGIRLLDGRFHAPEGDWGCNVYIVVYPKENKRKMDDSLENSLAKTKKMEGGYSTKATDLICLGLPWKSSDEDVRAYFEQFGEVVLCQIKKELKTGQSKGYGFVRFADIESQNKVLSQRHCIDGRWCEVRIPNSRESNYPIGLRKIFVGRLTEDISQEDLRNYFSKFDECTDVFIPKPFRGFAFVTLMHPEVAQRLTGEDHIIKGISVHVSSAEPKQKDRERDMRSGRGGGRGFDDSGRGGTRNGGWQFQNENMGGGGGAQPNQGGMSSMANNPMGALAMNNLLTPAMLAAATAALSQPNGPWGNLLGIAAQQQQQQGGVVPNQGGGVSQGGPVQDGGHGSYPGAGGGGGGGYGGSLGWQQGATGDTQSSGPGWGATKQSPGWN